MIPARKAAFTLSFCSVNQAVRNFTQYYIILFQNYPSSIFINVENICTIKKIETETRSNSYNEIDTLSKKKKKRPRIILDTKIFQNFHYYNTRHFLKILQSLISLISRSSFIEKEIFSKRKEKIRIIRFPTERIENTSWNSTNDRQIDTLDRRRERRRRRRRSEATPPGPIPLETWRGSPPNTYPRKSI